MSLQKLKAHVLRCQIGGSKDTPILSTKNTGLIKLEINKYYDLGRGHSVVFNVQY
jgi:hypothetical protein